MYLKGQALGHFSVPMIPRLLELERGLIGSLMDRKGKLGWGWGARKDFWEFFTKARLPSNVVTPSALWLFGCYITDASGAPIVWTQTQFYL